MRASRSLFAFLLCIVIAVAVFFKFHGLVLSASSAFARAFLEPPRAAGPAAGNDYAVSVLDRGARRDLPPLPDLSHFTLESVESQAPQIAPGRVAVRSMIGLPAMRVFFQKKSIMRRLRLAQLEINPRAIVVQEGHYDIAALYEEVQKSEYPQFMQKIGETYLFRAPVLVGENASLTLSGRDAGGFMLSQEKGAFISNAGGLFILRARLAGWSEKTGKPAYFRDKDEFRPFITSWSGARLMVAGSTIAHLGYQEGKSYGLLYSSCAACLVVRPDLPPATGVLAGNLFKDLYFGFYSYEAEDVAVVGNTYADNVIYGIDPHDRSRRLIIAGNEVYGSKKKHGIIISRDVNDSWITGNNVHDNEGSGIMLDRTCRNNVIAGNVTAHNGGDGITLFESPGNVLYNNQIYRNEMSGIRVRNSWDIRFDGDQVADNGLVPIVIYSAKLEDMHGHRDFEEDPYEQRAAADFAGVVIKLTGRSAIKLDGAERVSLSGVHVLSGDSVFAGGIFPDETVIRRSIAAARAAVIVENRSNRQADAAAAAAPPQKGGH